MWIQVPSLVQYDMDGEDHWNHEEIQTFPKKFDADMLKD